MILVGSSKVSGRCEKFFLKTLTDVEKGVYVERWSISSDELGIGEAWSIEKRRLYGGLSDGVDIITVNNGKLSFAIVPTRGMGIWKGEYQGTPLGWASPIKDLVHPHYVNLEARGGLGWLDGFNEWIVRCGLVNFGAPGFDTIRDNMGNEKDIMLTLHGRIANIPAILAKVRIGLEPPFELGVEGVVYERAFFGSNLRLTTLITTTLGSNSLKISDTVENLRGVPDEMQLLYHCNYGSPFLGEGARLVAPIRRVAPRDSRAMEVIGSFDVYGPPESGFVEQVYFMELLANDKGHTKVMLVNRDETKAVSVSFSVKELPCFTLWKNTCAVEQGYVTGLEPGTSFPNPKRFERKRNRVVRLKPKEKYRSEVALSVHLGKDKVYKVKKEIEKIGGKTEPAVFKEPNQDFSPV
jgi:hypothetical protein